MTAHPNMRLSLRRDDLGTRYDVRAWAMLPSGGAIIAENTQFRQFTAQELDDGAGQPTPVLMSLSKDSLQAFMDELWVIGIRPTEGHGSTGQLAATERHLNDMRAMVAKAHGVELK